MTQDDNNLEENVVFAPCPFCRDYPSVREATEQERRLFPMRRFRLSHSCAGVNCLLYGKTRQDLSYEWTRFISSPIK